MSFFELEYKYKADNVQLSDFVALMEKLGYEKKLEASSWDIYYTQKETENNKFQRFRKGDTPELTKKIKTQDGNNWTRIEYDLPLDFSRVNEEIVTKFVKVDGYKENFRIYKTCFIYWQKNINYVFYVVYNENMEERGRFIEVEVNKEKVKELSNQEFDPNTQEIEHPADKVLREGEAELKALGITAQNRMKKSLFELFKN